MHPALDSPACLLVGQFEVNLTVPATRRRWLSCHEAMVVMHNVMARCCMRDLQMRLRASQATRHRPSARTESAGLPYERVWCSASSALSQRTISSSAGITGAGASSRAKGGSALVAVVRSGYLTPLRRIGANK